MSKIKDVSGIRFGRLIALRHQGSNADGKALWLCVCDCGNETTTTGKSLRAGYTQSCGCLRVDRTIEACTTHGASGGKPTPEYEAYLGAKKRCQNPKCKRYKDYGGRGIKFLFDSFTQFLKEIGIKPSSEYSLDRKNNDGHYEPGNVKWSTQVEQNNNRRKRTKFPKRNGNGIWVN